MPVPLLSTKGEHGEKPMASIAGGFFSVLSLVMRKRERFAIRTA